MSMWRLIPQDVIDEIHYEVGRNGLECADNYRAYRRRDGLLQDEFEQAREQGCCGSFESSIVDRQGDAWIIGCNYGH